MKIGTGCTQEKQCRCCIPLIGRPKDSDADREAEDRDCKRRALEIKAMNDAFYNSGYLPQFTERTIFTAGWNACLDWQKGTK
jgi:hypothetical protein